MIKNWGVPHVPHVPPTCTRRGGYIYTCVPLPIPYNRNKAILSFLNKKNTHMHTIHSTPLDAIGGGTCGTCGTPVFEHFKTVIDPLTPNLLSIVFFQQIFSSILGVFQ